ncbi:MAG: hypothetical protein JXM70_12290 [Pirellulales bacterium]|nr:hypothetical protein [Pirellulales bacterium]
MNRVGWTVCGILLIILAGCGDGRPHRVPVSGQILIDGKPLSQGTIRLVSENARPATGTIGPDGRFSLGTYERDDGCVPGRHRVAVVALEIINGSAQRWHAPKKYAQPGSSGLSVDISEATDSLSIELSWNGQPGPVVERFGSSP